MMDIADQPALPVVGGADESRFIYTLYEGFLGRQPSPQEVAHHLQLLKNVSPLALVMGVAQSDEARKVQDARALSVELTTTSQRAVEPLAIRADDVLTVIGEILSLTTTAEPTFDQVKVLFRRFAQGDDLSTIIRPQLEAVSRLPGGETHDSIADAIRILYSRILHRLPSEAEVAQWQKSFSDEGRLSRIVATIHASEEARNLARSTAIDLSPGVIVQMAFEIILERGASAYEVDIFRTRLERDGLHVSDLVVSFFNDRVEHRLSAKTAANDPKSAYLYGSRGVIASTEWDKVRVPNVQPQDHRQVLSYGSIFAFDRCDGCAVSIITSMYRGGRYIRGFLENITAQTIFREHCELIIIDAASPDRESEVIAEFQAEFPNIKHQRCNSQIGIYQAWNMAIGVATGRYVTNANLDDARRTDSLEIQAAILDSLDFVGVTYQDVLYSFAPCVSFDDIEDRRLKTDLPIISRYNLMEFNSPHNAPMWRRSLHDKVGYFNESYRSAADFDFWLRCHIQGVTFFKSNDPHVAYYVNPEGLSTKPDTRGLQEANAASRAHYRQIVSPLLTLPESQFRALVNNGWEGAAPSASRYDVVQAALRRLGSIDRAWDVRDPA